MRILVLGIAVVAAGVAAFLVNTMLSANNGPAVASAPAPNMNVTQVLVASRNLTIGHAVGSSDLRWQAWPEEALTASYITKRKDPSAQQKTVGATVRQPVLAGEPITSTKVIRTENAGFMAALLDPGMRAVSVKISPETGAGGFILPNDRVDVIVTRRTMNESGTREGFESETILYNVRVLAIDQNFQEEDDKQTAVGRIATLELTPNQAETVSLGEAMGDLSLILRSIADMGAAAVEQARNAQEVTTSVTMLRYGASTRVPVGGGAR